MNEKTLENNVIDVKTQKLIRVWKIERKIARS
jgi:hypothetical protein